MRIAVRELKSSLSKTLALAQAGEVIEVTSHNKPIARIVGIPPESGAGVRALISSGVLSWSGSKPELADPIGLNAGGNCVSRILLEDRG